MATARNGSFRGIDRVYRRGLVLGLTVAELFLLLLFLLLLILAGLSIGWKDEFAKLESELETTKDQLIVLEELKRQLREYGVTPDKIETLLKRTERLVTLDKEVAQLKPLAELGRKFAEAAKKAELDSRELVEEPEALIETLQNAKVAQQLRDEQEKLQAENDQLKREQKDSQNAIRSLASLNKIAQQLRDEQEKLQAENDQLKREQKNSQNAIRSLANSKGIDPSCWFTKSANRSGKEYEKQVPLFDVAVFDNHFLVRDIPALPEYVIEKLALPVGDVKFMTPLTNSEFRNMMMPIRRMGKEERKVREYSCVFYVRVWDETSAGAKERWKNATEGVIGSVFYRDTVKGESFQTGNN